MRWGERGSQAERVKVGGWREGWRGSWEKSGRGQGGRERESRGRGGEGAPIQIGHSGL